MRARNIKPGFFRNEQLMHVPPLGRLLFAGLWCLADREGRLIDRPNQIKWDVLPADDCDVDALLDDLAARGFVRRYTVDGTRYLEVVNFLRHQRPHYKETASSLPPPTISLAQNSPSTRLIPDCGYSDCGYSDKSDPLDTTTSSTTAISAKTGKTNTHRLDNPAETDAIDIASAVRASCSVPPMTEIQSSVQRIADLWQQLSGKKVTRAAIRLIERALTEGYREQSLCDLLHAKNLEYATARSRKHFTLANLLGDKLPHHLTILPTAARTHARKNDLDHARTHARDWTEGFFAE